MKRETSWEGKQQERSLSKATASISVKLDEPTKLVRFIDWRCDRAVLYPIRVPENSAANSSAMARRAKHQSR